MTTTRQVACGIMGVVLLAGGCWPFPFPPGGWVYVLQGVVLDEETQTPIPGATVVVGELGGMRALAPEQDFKELDRVQTDESGRFKWSRGFERHHDAVAYFKIELNGYAPTTLMSLYHFSTVGGEAPRNNRWLLKKSR